MDSPLNIKLYAFMIDCKEPRALARFYAELLGWDMPFHSEEYAVIAPAGVSRGAYPGITFQRNEGYQPPVWPDEPGAQQQMAHIDIAVDDLERAVEHAVCCGAKVADAQFSGDWKVMTDPAGHPFCLCMMRQIFATDQ